jgi:hypothetical protein
VPGKEALMMPRFVETSADRTRRLLQTEEFHRSPVQVWSAPQMPDQSIFQAPDV